MCTWWQKCWENIYLKKCPKLSIPGIVRLKMNERRTSHTLSLLKEKFDLTVECLVAFRIPYLTFSTFYWIMNQSMNWTYVLYVASAVANLRRYWLMIDTFSHCHKNNFISIFHRNTIIFPDMLHWIFVAIAFNWR